MTEQEQSLILEARQILARYINRNPVLTSWQAVLDYCALYADAGIMPISVPRSLFLAGIAAKGSA